MKKIIIFILSFFFLSSCSSLLFNKRYIYIDGGKEWELELILYNDSSFVLKDKHGYTQFNQKGKWKIAEEKGIFANVLIIISDTTKYKYNFFNNFNHKMIIHESNNDGKNYSNREDFFFPLITLDTIQTLDRNKLLLRGMTFNHYKGDVQKRKRQITEKFFIDKFGRKIYRKYIAKTIDFTKL